MQAVVKQAESTVEKTPQLLSPLKEAGVVDAGGRGYEIFWKVSISTLLQMI